MPHREQTIISCDLVTGTPEFTLEDFCKNNGFSIEKITAYVEEGIVEPQGAEIEQWRFSRLNLIEIHRACRLESELGLNAAGIALAFDLTAQIEELKARLKLLE